MDARDAGSVRFAAVVLLALSGVRWGCAAEGRPTPGDAGDVLGGLSHGAAAAVEAADRARLPLGDGERIDPNRADAVELDRLPGIGPATAQAVVEAREGGVVFRSPSDLETVGGIGPRTVERMRPHLGFEDVPSYRPRNRADRPLGTVDVNRAPVSELVTLPGVGPVLAERIVSARRERPFDRLDDLTRIPGVGPATVERLRGRAEAGSVP